ncbi:MAG: molecular chaperone [Adlercreutzia equolifaciens]
MTDVVSMRRESIDLEALLLSRTYLYTLFHKLFGGTPDAAVVACVLSETTRDVVEEYAGDDPSMKGLGRFLENLGECVDGAVLTEQARDEYTRLFIGPGELPCQPMESPYRTKDAAVFQENTLAVRAIFREHGLQLARLMRIPDDHIATMCGFMAHEAERSRRVARGERGRLGRVPARRRGLRARPYAHLGGRFRPLRAPLEDGGALPADDRGAGRLRSQRCRAALGGRLLGRGGARRLRRDDPRGLGALPGSPEAAAFAEVSDALAALARLHPFGVEDHELVSISV